MVLGVKEGWREAPCAAGGGMLGGVERACVFTSAGESGMAAAAVSALSWLLLRGALAQEGSLSTLEGPEGMVAAPQACEPRRGWCCQSCPRCPRQELCWGC